MLLPQNSLVNPTLSLTNRELKKDLPLLALPIIAIVFVFKGIIMPIKVDGSSMYPTLHDGDLAFMSRLDLNSKQIKRFDIVTLDCKQLDNVIIKRVIGLPGEKIVYKNDCLYVNGKYIKENYLNKSHIKDVKSRYNISYFTDDFEISVGENEIFVLGDNRVNSLDSRELGCFKIENVLSKKGIILFPFNHMKGMN